MFTHYLSNFYKCVCNHFLIYTKNALKTLLNIYQPIFITEQWYNKKYLQALAKVLTIPIQHLKTFIIWLCSHNMVNAVNI